MLVEYVKDNYYARFHDPSYHRYREINCLQTLTDGWNDGREVELLYHTLL